MRKIWLPQLRLSSAFARGIVSTLALRRFESKEIKVGGAPCVEVNVSRPLPACATLHGVIRLKVISGAGVANK